MNKSPLWFLAILLENFHKNVFKNASIIIEARILLFWLYLLFKGRINRALVPGEKDKNLQIRL